MLREIMNVAPELGFPVLVTAMGILFNRKNEEDETVVSAHEFVQDALSDADSIKTIETITGKNMRNQISVEELMEINEEIRLRKQENRN